MKKIICSICQKETENSQQYELPGFLVYGCYGRISNRLLSEIIDNKCGKFTADLCPDCAYELAHKIFTMQIEQ